MPAYQNLQVIENGQSSRKLILHFDARNTIFVADLNSRITIEKALNTYIAGVVWGDYSECGDWICQTDVPMLRAPMKGNTSIYKHMEKEIVVVPEDRGKLREQLGNFTQTDKGEKFRPYFENCLEKLLWPYKEDVHCNHHLLTVSGSDSNSYHYLLPSFIKLIRHLCDMDRDFCIIIRTFGNDGPHILKAINELVHGRYPEHSKSLNKINVKNEVEKFTWIDKQTFHYECIDKDGKKAVLTNPCDVYEHWNNSTGILAVVDDFVHWQKHNYNYCASKPLFFDPTDKLVHHIIFDDNVRVEDEDNIISMCELDSVNHKSTQVEPIQAELLENKYFVQADLLESIKNNHYFIEKVAMCESNLVSGGLKRRSSQGF